MDAPRSLLMAIAGIALCLTAAPGSPQRSTASDTAASAGTPLAGAGDESEADASALFDLGSYALRPETWIFLGLNAARPPFSDARARQAVLAALNQEEVMTVVAGNKEFYRLQGGGSHYLPHMNRFVLESRVSAGMVNEYSDTEEVPIFERFFAGGANSVRGFRERRVGPLDPVTNDPVGGESTLLATIEEVMTIVEDERGRPILKGTVFLDIGNVWDQIGDFGEDFKSGAGIGTRINTPIGPVRLDLGIPVSGLGDDKRKARFHFNVSRSF